MVCVVLFLFGGIVNAGTSKTTAVEESRERIKVAEEEYDRLMGTEGNTGESERQTNFKEPEATYQVSDTIFSYWQDSIGSNSYFGCVEIKNTGSENLYLADATFDFEDNDGHLLKSESFISSCPDIICPGETGYFFNNIGSLDLDSSQLSNGVVFKPDITVKEATGEPVDYEVSDLSLKPTTMLDLPTITGRITNTTEDVDNAVTIYGVFRGLDGRPIAISLTHVMEFEPGKTKGFEITNSFSGHDVKIDDISSYEVIARKMYLQF